MFMSTDVDQWLIEFRWRLSIWVPCSFVFSFLFFESNSCCAFNQTRHSIEIPLVFNVSSLWSPDSHEALTSKAMGDRWIEFAISGNPNRSDDAAAIQWTTFDATTPSWLAFNTGGHVAMEIIE
jgi:carboxylesterase type B